MDWQLILGYVKVLLSVQMVTAILIIIFMKRYNKEIKSLLERLIKLPGGVELSTPQLGKVETEQLITDKISSEPQFATIPPTIQEDKVETFKALYDTERARAYFWEYCYLNFFLVPRTQQVLDWLASSINPITVPLYESLWMPLIPDIKERQAIISAIERHVLIEIHDSIISVTPKGREYIEWRSKVLNAPSNT